MRLVAHRKCHLSLRKHAIIKKNISLAGVNDDSLTSDAQVKVTECILTPCYPHFTTSSLNICELPQSLLIAIFSQLKTTDLQHASLVCTYWLELSRDPDLWRDIDLRGLIKVEDETVLRLVTYSSNVQSINISDSKLITDEGLQKMTKLCPRLNRLVMRRCQRFTEAGLAAIGENCPDLVYLDMDCCFGLNDNALSKIAAGCRHLDTLVINQCNKVTDVGIIAVSKYCHTLHTINVAQLSKIGDECLYALADGCPNLNVFNSMASKFTHQGMSETLPRLEHLTSVDLPSVESVCDDTVISIIKNCPRMALFNVSLCPSVTDISTHYLAVHARHIKNIYLVSCPITDKTCESLARYAGTLESLDIGWCQAITDKGAVIMCEGCPRLKHLGLMRCDQVTNNTAEELCQRFPAVHISTRWLDLNRLMNKVRAQGIEIPEFPRTLHFP